MLFSGPNFIAIEGNIGSGKTSLARKLSAHFNSECILEEFEKNPFLNFFYAKPKDFAFPLEYTFFLDRLRQLMTFNFNQDQTFIADYLIQKCIWFAGLTLSKAEFEFFKTNFESLTGIYPKPDIVFFLHLPLKNVIDNIENRGRQMEKMIKSEYLNKLNDIYKFQAQRLIDENNTSVFQFFLSDNRKNQYDLVFEECVKIIGNWKKNQHVSKNFQI